VSLELEQIWSRVQAQLALVIDEPTYRMWLDSLSPVELRGEHLVLEAPTAACRWIQGRFGRVIQASSQLVLGPDASVELRPARTPSAGRDGPRNRATLSPPAPAPSPPSLEADPLGNPKLTFDQFVIGDSNRLAHAAALAVSEMPSDAYNPLFICGPPGVGKTHLLSAIANLLATHNPTLTVRATTG
jgi:chromosomal replication initiator protein